MAKKTKLKSTQTRIRVLKCRETGVTGSADVMEYDRETGRNRLVTEFDLAGGDFDPHSTEEDIAF
jgi:hypothetical protein